MKYVLLIAVFFACSCTQKDPCAHVKKAEKRMCQMAMSGGGY